MRKAGLVLLAGILSSVSLAQQIPLENWTVPPYVETHSTSGGIVPMTDITPPRVFVGVQPCRVVDTRGGGVFTGTYGPPSIAANATRPFDINSAPHCPGIPAIVSAYSLNFTVTQTAGAPGDIRVWPTGNPPPPGQVTSVLNWTVPNATVANATIMPAGTSGSIDVQVAGTATHLLIDINGYFAGDFGNPNTYLSITNNSFNPTISAVNVNTDGGGAVSGTSWGGTGVSGVSSGTGAAHIVQGVYGGSNSQHFDSAGVTGGGYYKGVLGISHPVTNGAGVLGTHQPGINVSSLGFSVAGVRGEGSGLGVLGISRVVGTAGTLVNTGGAFVVEGYLGYDGGATKYGVYATANIGGTGAKHFVEPHPTDGSKVIRYISLEGNEPGTYFRGRGTFERGMARIAVPEDFRMVTDQEGLTVQITPIGAMATVSVMKADLNEIVVRASRNVGFYYMVNGIRRTHKHLTSPIGEGREYMPRSADATMPLYLTEGQKQLLIQNGTYNADGTVNMETARRVGWDRVWAERERPVPMPQPE